MLGLSNAMTSGSYHEQQYSLLLDGNSDYLRIEDNAALRGFSAFSVSVWAKADSKGNYERIIDYCSSAGNEDLKFRFLFNSATDQAIYARVGLQNGSGYSVTDPTAFPTGEWVHYILTFKNTGAGGATPRLKLYKNGNTTPVATNDAHGSDLDNTSTGPLLIGTQPYSPAGHWWDGNIDEVAIWNTDLDANAVEAVYNSGKPFDLNYDRGYYDNSSALVGYWRMFNGPFDDLQNGVVHDAHNPGFGAELASEGDFSGADDGNPWTTAAGWTIANGVATCSSGNDNLEQNVSAQAGKTYKITVNVTLTSGRLDIDIGDCTAQSTTSSGTQTFYMVAVNTDNLRFYGGAFRGSIDNVSVVQLNGHPGLTAATATFSADTPDD